MDSKKQPCMYTNSSIEYPELVRKGPWTTEEDFILTNYIAHHGQGLWNSLAKAAGLKRTGKSCRLRWLNYLQPNVRRGNITLEEQLLIMELQAKLGNRWSKIAKHLPGRTDNEIKNFWRTRIQKHMKQLPENSSDRPPLHRHAFVMPDILQPSSPPANLWLDGINCDHRLGNTIPMPDTYTSPAAFPAAPDAFQESPSMESNISYWSMEGLLSEKLLNGD